jgi:23S rRNA pseudoU1915 N3-methylase RlmH
LRAVNLAEMRVVMWAIGKLKGSWMADCLEKYLEREFQKV